MPIINNGNDGNGVIRNVGNDIIGTMLTMKMLKSMDSNDDGLDFGKLYLFQQMSNGKPITISDVAKTKLINKLERDGDGDGDGDMNIEKIILLQMLEKGELDIMQLVAAKMMGSMFDEKKKEEKKA